MIRNWIHEYPIQSMRVLPLFGLFLLKPLKFSLSNRSIRSTQRYMSQSADNSGLLYCQVNSYSKSLLTDILSRENNEDGTQSVVLRESVFYVEGGGQPSDSGTVDGIPIVDLVKTEDAHVKAKLARPLEESKTNVLCEVDWVRRYDIMQQHTAQHLFSAVADVLFGCDTIGWALQKDSVTVDLLTNTLLTSEQLDQLEDSINLEIAKGSEVSAGVYHKDMLDSIENLRGAPKGAALALSELRLVSIAGLDSNPCGGTHLKSLSEIQLLKIISIEKDRNASRVRFVAGKRALDYFRVCVKRDALLSTTLSSPPEEFNNIVTKLHQDKRELAKSLKSTTDELIQYITVSLSKYIVANSVKSLIYHRYGTEVSVLLAIADNLANAHPDVLIFIGSCTSHPEPSDGKKKAKTKDVTIHDFDYSKLYTSIPKNAAGNFVLAGEKTVVDIFKAEVMEVIGGRGGGRPGRLQGTATNLENIEAIRSVLSR